ncbi:MAG: transposase [Nitrospira sp.]|nr:transposase [Nitrospira sp.]
MTDQMEYSPLYQQSDIHVREGATLTRFTLAEWVGQCTGLLAPLVDALRR